MTITIGINANHADSAISIFKNNKLIFAIEEERINRIKHWSGIPIESLKLGIKYCGINIDEIENIATNSNVLSNLRYKLSFYVKNYLLTKKTFEIYKRYKNKFNLKEIIIKTFDLKKKVNFRAYDHHLCHLASAYYPSNFNDAIALSIDGSGDFCSLAIAKCKNNKIEIIKKIYYPNSIGVFYEAVTQLIGFKNYGEEYKMMGLSSYGKPRFTDIMIKKIFHENNLLKLNLKYFNHTKKDYSYNFLGSPNQKELYSQHMLNLFDTNIENIKSDIASSAQKVFEIFLTKIVSEIKKINFSKNLVFAGGCALNSLANKILFNESYFNNVYIPYAPSDAGGSIGSALIYLSKKYKNYENLSSPYLGPSFTNDEIKKILYEKNIFNKFKVICFENENLLIDNISDRIIKKEIVGLFNGRMEFGARALGNRSIIATPLAKDIKDIINIKIKRRENFRPFAPAIIKEKKKEWFYSSHFNPYMSNVENIIKEKQNLIPAVTHIDGTGRVQTVCKKDNERFYNLIFSFYKKTNVPILLNTSFNENEPIVMKPDEAIECFLRTKMDTLVLENYMVTRNI
jgi:carbamoyltransferase